MAAPLPPPKIAPRTAPIAAPPPTYLPVRLFAPRPPGAELLPAFCSASRYLRPFTVTDRRSRLVSLPSEVGTATSCARDPREITTSPPLSLTSSLTEAEKLAFLVEIGRA